MLVITPFVIAGAAFETWNRVIVFWSSFVLQELLAGREATGTPPSSSLASGSVAPPSAAPPSSASPNLLVAA